jgi:hypothetical protein
MLTIGYEVFEALVELKIQEMQHEARIRRIVHAAERARPGWFSRKSRRLCGRLGTWLVVLGRKLQAYHAPQAIPFQQALDR